MYNYTTSTTKVAPIVFTVLIILFIAYGIFRRYQNSVNKIKVDLPVNKSIADQPIISSAEMLSEPNLQSVTKLNISGFDYNVLTNDKGRLMLLISLHSNTNCHIVAIGNKSDLSESISHKINSNFLIEVKLEGDFPDYFKLYCSPSKQIELREILDPSTMQFLVDYCRAYDLEIYNDALFISLAAKVDNSVTKDTLLQDTEKLLNNISNVITKL